MHHNDISFVLNVPILRLLYVLQNVSQYPSTRAPPPHAPRAGRGRPRWRPESRYERACRRARLAFWPRPLRARWRGGAAGGGGRNRVRSEPVAERALPFGRGRFGRGGGGGAGRVFGPGDLRL